MSYQPYQQPYVVAAAPPQPQPYAVYEQYAPQGAPPQYQPVPVTYAPPGGYADEIRTIFITGFPNDLRERELINMCRFMPDFDAASLKMNGSMAQGFVLFRSGGAAHSALHQLNGLRFCEGCSLRCEMARKNMFVKDNEISRPSKMPRAYDDGPSRPREDRNTENPPCDTLFVGNLSNNVTDDEIAEFFQRVKPEGFKAVKTIRKHNGVTAFVQWVDVPTAIEVHDSQQGVELPGSNRGPLRIQFSKNALGESNKRKREEYGAGGGYPAPQAQPYQPQPYVPSNPAALAATSSPAAAAPAPTQPDYAAPAAANVVYQAEPEQQ